METRSGRSFFSDDNFLTGILFVALGTFAAIYGSRYGLGSMQSLGAGAFPVLVSALLCAIGATLIAKALRGSLMATRARPFQLRSVICISAAVVFGGAVLQALGVVVAIPGAVIIASLAADRIHWKLIVVTALFLTAFTYVVFYLGLGAQLPLHPGAM